MQDFKEDTLLVVPEGFRVIADREGIHLPDKSELESVPISERTRSLHDSGYIWTRNLTNRFLEFQEGSDVVLNPDGKPFRIGVTAIPILEIEGVDRVALGRFKNHYSEGNKLSLPGGLYDNPELTPQLTSWLELGQEFALKRLDGSVGRFGFGNESVDQKVREWIEKFATEHKHLGLYFDDSFCIDVESTWFPNLLDIWFNTEKDRAFVSSVRESLELMFFCRATLPEGVCVIDAEYIDPTNINPEFAGWRDSEVVIYPLWSGLIPESETEIATKIVPLVKYLNQIGRASCRERV